MWLDKAKRKMALDFLINEHSFVIHNIAEQIVGFPTSVEIGRNHLSDEIEITIRALDKKDGCKIPFWYIEDRRYDDIFNMIASTAEMVKNSILRERMEALNMTECDWRPTETIAEDYYS